MRHSATQPMDLFVLIMVLLAFLMVTIVVLLYQAALIGKLRSKLQAEFPDTSGTAGASAAIGHIILLLQSMKGQLVDGDFRILVEQANDLSIVKANGEISYRPGLKKVLFTPMPSNLTHIYGK